MFSIRPSAFRLTDGEKNAFFGFFVCFKWNVCATICLSLVVAMRFPMNLCVWVLFLVSIALSECERRSIQYVLASWANYLPICLSIFESIEFSICVTMMTRTGCSSTPAPDYVCCVRVCRPFAKNCLQDVKPFFCFSYLMSYCILLWFFHRFRSEMFSSFFCFVLHFLLHRSFRFRWLLFILFILVFYGCWCHCLFIIFVVCTIWSCVWSVIVTRPFLLPSPLIIIIIIVFVILFVSVFDFQFNIHSYAFRFTKHYFLSVFNSLYCYLHFLTCLTQRTDMLHYYFIQYACFFFFFQLPPFSMPSHVK